jgi:hypothetical protein
VKRIDSQANDFVVAIRCGVATWQRRKAAGIASDGLRPIWLPTVDNLRNFLLTFGAKPSELEVLFGSQ